MTLIQKIKDDINTARRRGEKKKISILSTLYGKASAIGKNKETTDEECIKVIKRFIANNEEIIKIMIKRDPVPIVTPIGAQFENVILNDYLPKQMDTEELTTTIQDIITETREQKVLNK
ncbi:MAG: GatB/YqeY domain-containing protein [Proteobacteria bacterium]|nr:GatB/YqeY domain-containing protein [Pseudomonadota bacterium]